MRKWYLRSLYCIVFWYFILNLSCTRKTINLTPDTIRAYGLDQMTLPRIQLYYRTMTIRPDSTVSTEEPTIFRRIRDKDATVTEKASPAASTILDKDDIVIIKNGTPCKITDIIDNGRILRADFGGLSLDFALSYKTGYTFEMINDTVCYQGKTYLRSHIPLMRSVGILSVEKRTLEQTTATETRIRGKIIE